MNTLQEVPYTFDVQYSNDPDLNDCLMLGNHTIFLAGPSLRAPGITPWREVALSILRELTFRGSVFVPEIPERKNSPEATCDYTKQISWEYERLIRCSAIVMWMPRTLEELPGFTSNVEFGRYVSSGRLFYGRPTNTPKTAYLDWLYRKVTGRHPHNDLYQLLKDTTEWLSI